MIETLGDYRKLSFLLFGEDSGATKFLDAKIAEQGRDEKVVQHESQMLWLLAKLDKEQPKPSNNTDGS